MAGSYGRSVKVHGVIVYLDKGSHRPTCKPHSTDGAAMTQPKTSKQSKPADELNAKQRRSRRRLEKRIAQRDAVAVQERPPKPQAGGERLAATCAAMGRVRSTPANPFAEFLSSTSPVARKSQPATAKAKPLPQPGPSTHTEQPAHAPRARGSSGGERGGNPARGEGDHAETWPMPAKSKQTAKGKHPVRRTSVHGSASKAESTPAPDVDMDY